MRALWRAGGGAMHWLVLVGLLLMLATVAGHLGLLPGLIGNILTTH